MFKKGHKHSQETKNKIRTAITGRRHSDESKRKVNLANKGRKHTLEARNKISSAMKGLVRTPEHCSKLSISSKKVGFQKSHTPWNKGRPDAMLGKKHSKETKKKMSIARLKAWSTEDYVKNWVKGVTNSGTYCNTKPELKMKELLNSLNIEYIHQKWIKGVLVDFYIPSKNLIIEVDGCYWHGCPIHCPDSYPDNVKRDEQQTIRLQSFGYEVKRFWEHDLQDMRLSYQFDI